MQVFPAIFANFKVLYKNFIHWNVSKLLIYILSFVLGLLLSMPFFVILWWMVYFDPISWKEIGYNFFVTEAFWLSLLEAVSEHLVYLIIEWFLLILWVLGFLFWTTYSNILFAKLNIDYHNKLLTWYGKNYYFHWGMIWKFLWILSWIGLIALIPFFILVLVFAATVVWSGWIESFYLMMVETHSINSTSLFLLWVTIILLVVFFYLMYRMAFSYIILVDEKNYPTKESAWFYVKESFAISWGWKVFPYIGIMILFALTLWLLDMIFQWIFEYIGSLWWSLFLLELLYWVVVFLLFTWLTEMVYVSLYFSIMRGENQENPKDLPWTEEKIQQQEII